MPGVTTLPDELIDLLAEMYGEVNPATKKRWTLRQLAVFASEKAGRRIERPVVERAIKPVRAERAQMAREVAREVDVERVVGNGARVRVRAVEYVGEGAGL